MNITPITPTNPACYGITCPQHGQCARYAAVEESSPSETIATCEEAPGVRPLFVSLVEGEPA